MRMKLVATALVASLAVGSMTAPASAFFGPHFFKPHFFWKPYKPHYVKPPKSVPGVHQGNKAIVGQLMVGCIFGGALGLIGAALAKGKAYNDPKIELTQNEVLPIVFSCGLATGPVIASFNRN